MRDDTWEWDGSKWEQVATSGPSGRFVNVMVFDPVRRKMMLFGGEGPAQDKLGDTWEWDGKRWEKRDVPGPPARSAYEMIYDSKRKRAVLFGGLADGNRPLNDTWEWDGERWSEVKTSGPPPRILFAMAYDEKRGVTIVFGGANPTTRQVGMADTWLFDGERWQEATGAGPMGRDHHAMTYDAARQKVVLFGGGGGVDRRHVSLGDTWEWDGVWTIRTDVAGPARSGKPSMTYDSTSKQIWIYGGYDPTGMIGDLWRFDGKAWRPAPKAPTN